MDRDIIRNGTDNNWSIFVKLTHGILIHITNRSNIIYYVEYVSNEDRLILTLTIIFNILDRRSLIAISYLNQCHANHVKEKGEL